MQAKLLFPINLSYSNRWKRDYLTKKFGEHVDLLNSEILEIGIGNGRFGFLLADSFKKYYGIDPDEDYLEIARKNTTCERVEYKLGRAEEIPFKKQFDIVFYANSWHYVKNFDKALDETARVLKPEGIVAILEPEEKSTIWANPKLNFGSPEFDPRALACKMAELEIAEKALREQSKLKIVEYEKKPIKQINFYILKKA
jgi:ubiquinone/menaquinone biosynthesis C-methylase UbiE